MVTPALSKDLPMPSSRFAVVVVLLLCVGYPASVSRLAAAGQNADSAVVAAVKRALSNDSDLRRLTVTVSGSEVTLTGRVPTLWKKQEAVRRTLKVDGVKTVVAELELSRVEDQNLAFYIGQAVDAYAYQTIFDYIDAVILKGVVTLKGSVTGERNKAQEIADQVAKVRGVQEIRNEIVTLPPTQGDDDIRAAIYDRVTSNMHLEQAATVRNPLFRIIVHNGAVTLYGWVQGEIEYRELEQIARFTPGVLRVTNNLRTRTKPRG
jgi:osmotically-inducible protein OsmY